MTTAKKTLAVCFTKSRDNKGIWFKLPYLDRNWIEEVKQIPWEKRAWDQKYHVWWISGEYAKKVFELCKKYFVLSTHTPGMAVPLQPSLYPFDLSDLFNLGSQTGRSSRRDPLSFGGPLFQAYRILYLERNAPLEVVKAAYKALAVIYHPDHGGDAGKMRAINEAFELIKKARKE